eukprot:GILJ01015505.1.p1 GENE.GILJ01015505.1~~GILJ01015505.1.p1  ORF type:complete len:168 (-),score=38.23 GILJ01015505.1:78-581(-)
MILRIKIHFYCTKLPTAPKGFLNYPSLPMFRRLSAPIGLVGFANASQLRSIASDQSKDKSNYEAAKEHLGESLSAASKGAKEGWNAAKDSANPHLDKAKDNASAAMAASKEGMQDASSAASEKAKKGWENAKPGDEKPNVPARPSLVAERANEKDRQREQESVKKGW